MEELKPFKKLDLESLKVQSARHKDRRHLSPPDFTWRNDTFLSTQSSLVASQTSRECRTSREARLSMYLPRIPFNKSMFISPKILKASHNLLPKIAEAPKRERAAKPTVATARQIPNNLLLDKPQRK